MIGLRFQLPTSLFELRRDKTAQQDGEANRVDLSRRSLDEVGSSQERRRVGYDAISLDTQPLAAGSFILEALH